MMEIVKASNDDGSPSIRALDPASIQSIAAGEKINDIETAIRELIENAIDADAKNIEVKLTKFGIDTIEVEDNGVGIASENFSNLGLRYYTSKINSIQNLQNDLSTFGFRGEALSCLCNIANVTIVTKGRANPTGSRLIFKKDGTLGKIEQVARRDGTTIVLKNLFHSLPVRRRELEATAKRQYDKVVRLIYEHVLARPHIKFSLSRKSKVAMEKDFAHGGTNLEGCIITIFGVKTLESLVPIKQSGIEDVLDDKKVKDEKPQIVRSTRSSSNGTVSLPPEVEGKGFEVTREPCRDKFYKRNRYSGFDRERATYTIHGYISRLNQGRNSNDCQYLFVNKKPCDIPKLYKIINEIYKSFGNSNQYPFYCLFVQVQPWAADFNVPRKRTVILQDENRLIDIVQTSLNDLYSPMAPANQQSCQTSHIPVCSMKQGLKRELTAKTESVTPNKKPATTIDPPLAIEATGIEHISSRRRRAHNDDRDPEPEPYPLDGVRAVDRSVNNNHKQRSPNNVHATKSTRDPNVQRVNIDHLLSDDPPEARESIATADESKNSATETSTLESEKPTVIDGPVGFMSALALMPHAGEAISREIDCKYQQSRLRGPCNNIQIKIDHYEHLGLSLERERQQREIQPDAKEFSYAIHPNFNSVAEQELKFNLDKKSFEDMQVLGQFNRGFIIARLNKHLFIIDQHATDERSNYEDQLEKSPLIKQTMVHPKPLYLNSIREKAIIENLDAFKKRGFDFAIDESKTAGLRVMLTGTSICKGQGLDEYLSKEDVEELIDVLLESPHNSDTYILRKVKSVAATRACRKSVMIGDNLTWAQMTDIVAKMARLKNPWVCAHNRPTIRHLIDIDWVRQ